MNLSVDMTPHDILTLYRTYAEEAIDDVRRGTVSSVLQCEIDYRRTVDTMQNTINRFAKCLQAIKDWRKSYEEYQEELDKDDWI